MENNLYIVNTPLQLLTAYILANSHFQGMHNQLLVVNPSWQISDPSFYVRQLSHDTTTWFKIDQFQRWLRTASIAELREEISKMRAILPDNVQRVFLASDKNIANQLIVELSGNKHYYRIEDGVGSYTSPDRTRKSKLWHRIRVMYLRKIAGLNSDMQYNLGGIGHGKAALADYLYKPQLLERYSPKPVLINRTDVTPALNKVLSSDDGYDNQIHSGSILFLGGLQIEFSQASREEELKVLKTISEICKSKGLQLLYKPHPAERNEKLDYYQEEIPDIKFWLVRDPIEIIYARLSTLKTVVAHSSSGLLYADIFSRGEITTIALFKLYGNRKRDLPLYKLLNRGGTHIPEEIEQLKSILLGV